MKRYKAYLLLSILLIIRSYSYCQVSKVAGVYYGVCADNIMFGTALQLNPDMTFKYESGGDMEITRKFGMYSINHDTILISYPPTKPDTIERRPYDSIYTKTRIGSSDSGGYHITTTTTTYTAPRIAYMVLREEPGAVLKFYYRHSKLFFVTKEGKVVCHKTYAESRHKMFLLFGKHYNFMRRYYLVKVNLLLIFFKVLIYYSFPFSTA